MKLGLAGVGRIGAPHARILSELAEVESVLVADLDQRRAHQVATELGLRCLASPRALFDAGLDGLVVAASTEAHPELIIAAVEARLPVFCEKPVAKDSPATLAVLERIGPGRATVQIGFQRRFDPGHLAAHRAVRSGELGWLHTVRAATLDPAPPPAAYVARSGGLFRDCCVHDFDAIRWVTGREVVEVYARGGNRGASFFATAGDVDTAAAVLVLDDGTLAVVSGTRYNGAGYDVRLELLGSRDAIAVGWDDRLPLRSVEPGGGGPRGPAHEGFLARFRAAYRAELLAFLDVVAGRAPSPCPVEEALAALYVAEACDTSRRENRPVTVTGHR